MRTERCIGGRAKAASWPDEDEDEDEEEDEEEEEDDEASARAEAAPSTSNSAKTAASVSTLSEGSSVNCVSDGDALKDALRMQSNIGSKQYTQILNRA